jgi:iron only hydrogenase large subunit-like protein
MIKSYGIDFIRLPDSDFDAPLGISTGAGVIFGTTGGVMEATLRTAAEKLTGKSLSPEELEFKDVRAVEGLREIELNVAGKTLSIGVANGLHNAKTLLDKVVSGEKVFHVIEVMACPGGCIGGGGQPYPPENFNILDSELLALRAKALYDIDAQKTIRKSHENPALKELYDAYLGQPGSHRAHELLHTSYSPRLPRGIK